MLHTTTRYLGFLLTLLVLQTHATPDNIAPQAVITASSSLNHRYNPSYRTDGVIGVPGHGEWACMGDTTDWGYIRFPWIQLTWLNENTLTFDMKVGENNSINALAGFIVQEFNNERFSAYVFDVEDGRTGYHNLSAGTNPQAPVNGEMRWSMVPYLGRVQYSLKDKYLFTGTATRSPNW